jgi:hypothetical protein
MPTLITSPSIVEAAGNKPKIIKEFIGRVNSDNGDLSIAHMQSPGGWVEPGQASGSNTAPPEPAGADYVSVCLPAFSPQLVNRDP